MYKSDSEKYLDLCMCVYMYLGIHSADRIEMWCSGEAETYIFRYNFWECTIHL